MNTLNLCDNITFVFIPSCGNIHLLNRCIHGVEGFIEPLSNYAIVVVDDSVAQDISLKLNYLEFNNAGRIFCINQAKLEVFTSIINLTEDYQSLKNGGVISVLGESVWSPSRPRNVILYLIRILVSKQDNILFVDDDIMFDDFYIENDKFLVNKKSVFNHIFHNPLFGKFDAIGSKYIGVADISYHDSILNMRTNNEVSNLSGGKGIIESEDSIIFGTYESVNSLSSGFLRVSHAMSNDFHFPPFYNEDWLWLLFNSIKNKNYFCIPSRVGHFPLPFQNFIPKTKRFVEEEKGEVIFQLFLDSLNQLKIKKNDFIFDIAQVEKIISQRLASLNEAIKFRNRFNIFDKNTDKISNLLDAFRNLESEVILNELTSYKNQLFTWRKFTSKPVSKNKLVDNLSNLHKIK